MWCGIYQGWDLTEDFHLRLVCSVSTATFNGHLLCEPRGKRGTHMNKILGLAKIIRQGCPSHTVVPCRHKDGELCEECDITKSEQRTRRWHRPAQSWFQRSCRRLANSLPHRWDCQAASGFSAFCPRNSVFAEDILHGLWFWIHHVNGQDREGLGWAAVGIGGRGAVMGG